MEEQEKMSAGIVMLDDTYGFKVDSDCYVFGKVNEKGTIVNPVYPTSVEGVLKVYSKQRIFELSANKKMELNEFKQIVDYLQSEIKDLAEGLTVKW